MSQMNGVSKLFGPVHPVVIGALEKDLRKIRPGAKQIVRSYSSQAEAERMLDAMRKRSVIVEDGYSVSFAFSEGEFILMGRAPETPPRIAARTAEPIPFKISDPVPRIKDMGKPDTDWSGKPTSGNLEVVPSVPPPRATKSAGCYLDIVEAIESESRPGWIKVGEYPSHRAGAGLRSYLYRHRRNWKVLLRKNAVTGIVTAYVNKDPNAVD